ncbi:MAG TPA: hypothetical protein VFZ24_10440 [Longimicrobiales bacterium]
MQRASTLGVGLLALVCAACSAEAEGRGMAERGIAGMAAPVSAGGDSILPMPEMIERFQAGLPPVGSFGPGAAASREELIARFVAAVEDGSAAALRELVLNASEFAYLYFPTSPFAREPYAQPPAVNWLLLEQNGLKGERRLLREYGGKRLLVEGHRCAGDVRVEGANRLWPSCVLFIRRGDGRLEEMRLFGSIIERAGRYKLLSLANRL